MGDTVTEAPPLSAAEQEAVEKISKMNNENLVDKLKYLGMQMETMDEDEKVKHIGQFDGLAKTLAKLRRVLHKRMPATTWQWTIYASVACLVVIYAFFGYKLYRSLTEKERKREEKLKAKQSKKKK